MRKTLILPEDISEITLDQYQRFYELNKREDLGPVEYTKRVLMIFANLKYREVAAMQSTDFNGVVEIINKAIETDVEFVPRFKLDGVEHGFIPNLDEITIGEFSDMQEVGTNVETLHTLMAVLFRPVLKEDFLGNYDIVPYAGTQHTEWSMKQMPMHVVNGALFFFRNLARELRMSIQKSTMEVAQKGVQIQNISKSGVGM